MNCKNILVIVLLLTSGIYAQNKKRVEGKVSYISTVNVYVKFANTKGIKKGDKLFNDSNGSFAPVIKVEFLSSTSVSGKFVNKSHLKVGDKVVAFVKIAPENNKIKNNSSKHVATVENKVTTPNQKYVVKSKLKYFKSENELKGRFAVSAYTNTSNTNSTDYVRWRYTFSLNGDRVNNSNFSFDSYISFNYRSTDWANVKNNISNALKIYALSVKYNFSENTSVVVGRKINPVITNISVVDGLQFESKIGELNYGLIAGSRPNFSDYGLNAKLFEYGAYISNSTQAGFGKMQNSMAIFQQTNNFKTDRRFLYFQHNSRFVKNVSLFLSSEIDLYKRVSGNPQSTFSLTGFYTSLRFRPSRFISISASYDKRKNVIYYETFKSYADSLLDAATRQGLRLRLNLRPINRLSLNFSYGYRFMHGDVQKTNNYSGGFSYSRLPLINGMISGTYSSLKTSYLDGRIISVRFSKDIFGSAVYSSFGYRNIKYKFLSGINELKQDIFSIDLTWRALRKLNVNISYEGVFESINSYGRLYFNFTKRF